MDEGIELLSVVLDRVATVGIVELSDAWSGGIPENRRWAWSNGEHVFRADMFYGGAR